MSDSDDLLVPLRVVLSDLLDHAHERYHDSVETSSLVPDQLRLVAATEAFQILSAVQDMSQAVSNLERTMSDGDRWSKQADPEPLKMPRALVESEWSLSLRYGSWSELGEYLLALGERQIKVWPAGDTVVEPGCGVMVSVDDQEAVLVEPMWNEITRVVDFLLTEPPPAKDGEAEK